MDALCNNEPIFNKSLLLDSPWPHFTNCFQSSILIWAPCGWLWVTLAPYLIYIFKYHHGVKIRVNKLNIIKTVLSVLLFVFTLLHILEAVSDWLSKSGDGQLHTKSKVKDVVFVSTAIQAATYLLSAVLIQLERVKGVVTSGVLWIFWLLCVVAGIIPIYSKLYLQEYSSRLFPFALFYISYLCLWGQFVLSFFAETLNLNGYYNTTAGPCPELPASFPSRLIFSWMNKFIFFVYRRGLQEEDLFSLHPRDQGSKVIPQFQVVWNKELTLARNRLKLEELTPTSSYASFQQVSNKTSFYSESSPLLSPQSISIEVLEDRRMRKNRASLFKVLVKVYGLEMLASHFLMLVFDLLQFVSPLLLGALINFTLDREEYNKKNEDWKGYVLALSFLVVSVVSSILLHQCYHIGMTLGMRVKSALTASVFEKILTLSSYSRKDYPDNKMMSLMSVDCQRMQDVVGYLWMVWSAPLEIALATVMLWHVVGISTLAGIGTLILLMPVNAIVSMISRRYQRIQVKLKGQRVHLMNEIVAGMKIVKMHSWENVFMEKVQSIRSQELAILQKISFLNVASTVIWSCAPYLVPLATFTAYVLSKEDHHLDAYTAFVALALFNILRFPINLLPMLTTLVIHAVTSIKRIGCFLSEDDVEELTINYNPELINAIVMEKATFSWDPMANIAPTLTNISMTIPEGHLVAIVGHSGSGKSSVLSAILGQIEKTKGHVTIKSNIAYVPQQAWIQNGSIKDNILFFKSQDNHLYNKVLDGCALKSDLDTMPDRDDTELGERGIDITLDQKQRVNLARAVYQEADIYLFDDVLSGVDMSTGRYVFDKVISNRGILKGKTRILVTHDIHWLPQVDTVVVMTDGRITEIGSYDELMSHEGDFARFLKNTLLEDGDEFGGASYKSDAEISAIRAHMLEKMESSMPDWSSGDESWKTRSGEETFLRRSRSELTASGITLEDVREREKRRKERLLEEERVEIRKVKLSVILSYFKAIGVFATIAFFTIFIAYQSTNIYSSIWLANWTASDDAMFCNITSASPAASVNRDQCQNKDYMYLGIYGCLGLLQVILVLIFALVSSSRMVKAAGGFHNGMLTNIMQLPIAFFDLTPSGRILNRFSRDVDMVDNTLPQQLRSWINTFFGTLATIIVISYSTPTFLTVLIPLAIFYYMIQRLYIPVSRELKKMESITRIPIHSHFNETILGVSTIQAYKTEERYIMDSRHLVDRNHVCCYADVSLNRWLAIAVEAVGNLVVFFTAFLSVASDERDEALVGLAVCLSLQVTSGLSWMVRGLTDLESNLVSVERISHYAKMAKEGPDTAYFKEPMKPWPQTGAIRFHHVTTREKPSFDLVLNNISCDIQDGDKIGIIGTPGSDNYHLVQVLFRLVEVASGSVIIDNVRISDISLDDLRTGINILSVQDPVLFTGSLRMNLDPLDRYSDEDVWEAVRLAHLTDLVSESMGGLLYPVTEMGDNLSFSQRQLVCLARALLHKSKILVIDETPISPALPVMALPDIDTEDFIQMTIRAQFQDCTVLAITNHINTIMDYDRVMVIDQGTMREMASPAYLLQDENSLFYRLARDANLI